MGADLLDGDVELTEFVELNVRSVKGVKNGANGFPPLVMKGVAEPAVKADGTHPPFTGTHSHPHAANGDQGGDGTHEHSHSHDGDADHGHSHAEKSLPAWHAEAAALVKAVAADGSVDEQPDIDGGKQAIALIAKLIGYEAEELAAGCLGEVYDIQLLSEAVCALKCWLGNEQYAQAAMEGDGALMQSAADPGCGCCENCTAGVAKADLSTKDLNDLPDSAFAYIEPGHESEKVDGKTPGKYRHFAVHDKPHADNAAARIAQGAKFGDQALPKVKAVQKKFGEDTSKSRIAPEGEAVDTDAQGTGSLSKAVEDAIAKATAPLQERIKTLSDDLAKVKAAPVPGGLVLSRNVQVKAPGGVVSEDWAAKAARYRELADQVTDRTTADGYRKLAREADEKAVKQPG